MALGQDSRAITWSEWLDYQRKAKRAACKICGAEFVKNTPSQRTCGKACSVENERRNHAAVAAARKKRERSGG